MLHTGATVTLLGVAEYGKMNVTANINRVVRSTRQIALLSLRMHITRSNGPRLKSPDMYS